jgi:DNA-binding NarL/FixJ family response regulator
LTASKFFSGHGVVSVFENGVAFIRGDDTLPNFNIYHLLITFNKQLFIMDSTNNDKKTGVENEVLCRNPTNGVSLEEAYRKLSCRESEVLSLLCEVKSNQQISESLFISVDTVENHITKIGSKLGMNGRGKVRMWAKSHIKTT